MDQNEARDEKMISKVESTSRLSESNRSKKSKRPKSGNQTAVQAY